MCGRAGRPPFDDTGMVVIMTRKDTVVYAFPPPSLLCIGVVIELFFIFTLFFSN